MLKIYNHLDVWTCQKHNKMVLNHNSCDTCVREQRAALHAQGICLTEDARAPKPVRSFMKAPQGMTADKPCEKSFTFKYKINYPSDSRNDYLNLHSTVQGLFMALDTTQDERLCDARRGYQKQLAQSGLNRFDRDRLLENLAIDMWFEIWRTLPHAFLTDPRVDIKAQFIAYFIRLYDDGQRLIVDKPEAVTSQNPCREIALNWHVNLKSNTPGDYIRLATTTQALFRALDVTTDSKIIRIRNDYQNMLDSTTSSKDRARILENLAIDMFYEIVRVSKSNRDDVTPVMGQFIDYFKKLYGDGQRLVVDKPQDTPNKYVLNRSSFDWNLQGIGRTTQLLLQKLDKYEGDAGKTRVFHQKLIAVIPDSSESTRQRAVKKMAEDLWRVLPMDDHTRSLMKVRDQFLATVEYLYFQGQRLTEVPSEVPTQSERRRSLADDVYDYLMTSNNDLYHKQRMFESNLEACYLPTRTHLITAFRDLARDACESYVSDKMPYYNLMHEGCIYTLQTILADKYLEGVRR